MMTARLSARGRPVEIRTHAHGSGQDATVCVSVTEPDGATVEISTHDLSLLARLEREFRHAQRELENAILRADADANALAS